MRAEDINHSELIEVALKFWFNDQEHIRTPFPPYIREELTNKASERFVKWIGTLTAEAEEHVTEEVVAEKFEEILFEEANTLVETEDEKITILYPFLPRLGDQSNGNDPSLKEESIIIERMIEKKGDDSFLKVILEKVTDKEQWETKFDLPI